MDYDINELLFKMGISDLMERDHIRWHYMDGQDLEVGGFADARFENDGRNFVVELSHWRKNVENDNGDIEDTRVETVQLHARRLGDEHSRLFRITKLAFDGTEYDPENIAMVELCTGIFHARALDISETMMAQRLKSAEQELASAEDRVKFKYARRKEKVKSAFQTADSLVGVIIPFKPRKDAPFQRI